MKKTICPRCGSTNVKWIIPQVWSKWVCYDCSYTGPIIEAADDLIEEIKEDWESNKEKYLKEEDERAQEILSGEDKWLDEDLELEDEDDLSDEEMDKLLKDLNL